MKFVKLFGNNFWHEADFNRMRLYNYRGGWQDIQENSEGWMLATVIDADSWHDLWCKNGYCALACDERQADLWVDKAGRCYDGYAHEVCAEDIYEIMWGKEVVEPFSAADFLVDAGWIKLTTSGMLQYYYEFGMYESLTYGQEETVRKWAKIHQVHYFDEEEWF